MCTVSVVRSSGGDLILTSNRDESPSRSVNKINTESIENQQIMYPGDTAGGSWIVASNLGWFICVLNGAFKKHSHNPPYKKSRGIIAKEFFQYHSAFQFFQDINLEGIEPFTFIAYDQDKLYELRWDEKVKHFSVIDASRPHVWSSCTLYEPDMQERREKVFHNMLSDIPEISSSAMIDVHTHGKVGDPEQDFMMNRSDRVATISMSQIVVSRKKISLFYHDLVAQNKVEKMYLIDPVRE